MNSQFGKLAAGMALFAALALCVCPPAALAEEGATASGLTGARVGALAGQDEESLYQGGTPMASFEERNPKDLRYGRLTVQYLFVPIRNGSAVPIVKVTDLEGKTLEEGKDYELRYAKKPSYVEADLEAATNTPPSEEGEYYAIAFALESGGYTGHTDYGRFECVAVEPVNSVADLQSVQDPGSEGVDEWKSFTIEGAQHGLIVTFPKESYVDGYVNVYAMDTGAGALWEVASFYDDFGGRSVVVPTDTVAVRLITNGGYHDYSGYRIDSVDALAEHDIRAMQISGPNKFQLKRLGANEIDTPEIRVYYVDEDGGEHDLKEGEHYELVFSSKSEPGPATVTVVGKGDYLGTQAPPIDFEIVEEADISHGAATFMQLPNVLCESNTAYIPQFAIRGTGLGYVVPSSGYEVSVEYLGTEDPELTCADSGEAVPGVTVPGYYKFTAKGVSPYHGETSCIGRVFSSHDMSTATVWPSGRAMSYSDRYVYAYTGEQIVPKFQVALGGTLIDEAGYTVRFLRDTSSGGDWEDIDASEVRDVGRYKAVLEGRDPYFGIVEFEFSIANCEDASSGRLNISDVAYTGEPVTPKFTWEGVDRVLELTLGVDAEVTYYRWDDNEDDYQLVDAEALVEIGEYKAEVNITGYGFTDGEVSGYFEIRDARNLSLAVVEHRDPFFDDADYDPIMSVTLAGKTLSEGVDYRVVAYRDLRSVIESSTPPAYPGEFSVEIEGTGNEESGIFGSAVCHYNVLPYGASEPTAEVQEAIDAANGAAEAAADAKEAYEAAAKKAAESKAAAGAAGKVPGEAAVAAAKKAAEDAASAETAATAYETAAKAYSDAASAAHEKAAQKGSGVKPADVEALAAKAKEAASLAGAASAAVTSAKTAATEAKQAVAAAEKAAEEAAAKKAAEEAAKKAADLANATVEVAGATYTGKAVKPAVTVKDASGKLLAKGTDYKVSYKNNVKAGTATVTVTGEGAYTGAKTATFSIAKAKNPMKAKVAAKKLKVKFKAKSKKAVKFKKAKAFKVKGAKGKVTFKKANKAGGKRIAVAKGGKVTVKKGLKPKTYKVKVKVTARGNANYKKATKTVVLKIKVAK